MDRRKRKKERHETVRPMRNNEPLMVFNNMVNSELDDA